MSSKFVLDSPFRANKGGRGRVFIVLSIKKVKGFNKKGRGERGLWRRHERGGEAFSGVDQILFYF